MTCGVLWHLTWVKDSPGVKAESQILTKATFCEQGDASWESGAPCPSPGSALKGLRGPVVGLLALPSAKATSSCQTLGSRRENTAPTPSHLKQYQQNCGIKTTFRDTHSCRGRAKEVPCLYTVQVEPLRTAKLRHFGPSFSPSFFSMSAAKSIKDNLRGSMSSFCTPISFDLKALQAALCISESEMASKPV